MPILAMVRYRHIYRKMDFKGCVNALMESSVLSTMILMILVGALTMSNGIK
jgi:TRAP-type C4-dicarboxylate transport system permease large subunit